MILQLLTVRVAKAKYIELSGIEFVGLFYVRSRRSMQIISLVLFPRAITRAVHL